MTKMSVKMQYITSDKQIHALTIVFLQNDLIFHFVNEVDHLSKSKEVVILVTTRTIKQLK
jgi:hypothetical protein